MLGIDRKNADGGTAKPGGYPGIFAGQRCGGIQGPPSRGGLRVGASDAAADPLSGLEAERAGVGALLHRENEATEPRADNAATGKCIYAGKR